MQIFEMAHFLKVVEMWCKGFQNADHGSDEEDEYTDDEDIKTWKLIFAFSLRGNQKQTQGLW